MNRLKKIFEKVNKLILAAGALAVAIGAILLLINQLMSPPPPPPPKRDARFDHIEGPREITLAEYEADGGSRVGAAYLPDPAEWRAERGYRLLADTIASVPTPQPDLALLKAGVAVPETTTTPATETPPVHILPPTPTTETTPAHILPPTPTTETAPVHILPPTPTTTSPSTASGEGGEATHPLYRYGSLPSGAYRAHHAIIQEGNGTSPRKVSEMLADSFGESSSSEGEGTTSTETSTGSQTEPRSGTTPMAEAPPPETHRVALPRKCRRCALLPILESALADSDDNAEAAARELRAAEHEWRERNRGGSPQLVGVEVDYRLDLRGFEGKKVIVKYTIVESGRHLSPEWWGLRVAGKGTEPEEPDASIPEKLWALIPQAPGTYHLHLELYNSEGKELEYADTPTFH